MGVGQEISNPLWLAFMDTSAAALPLDLPFPHVSRSVADSELGALRSAEQNGLSGPYTGHTRSSGLACTS